ncbi:MAG: glyoxalase [Lachnospiraceae bacterium]|nr:glyoxalase [Lachnospiraceae bacterium]MBQ9580055.1 glyoxalase [Lachnospiraceae bacterium]MBR0434936.1 glyoxalase [Lachnospiraceae bacterium]
MYNYDEECLKAFMDNQEKLIGRKEFTTLEDADEFLSDVMAVKLESVNDVREYLIDAGMDAYGLSDEELCMEAEVFKLPSGKYLVVEG